VLDFSLKREPDLVTLDSITQHVKNQNCFASRSTFHCRNRGVFIGIQSRYWNGQRYAANDAALVALPLKEDDASDANEESRHVMS